MFEQCEDKEAKKRKWLGSHNRVKLESYGKWIHRTRTEVELEGTRLAYSAISYIYPDQEIKADCTYGSIFLVLYSYSFTSILRSVLPTQPLASSSFVFALFFASFLAPRHE